MRRFPQKDFVFTFCMSCSSLRIKHSYICFVVVKRQLSQKTLVVTKGGWWLQTETDCNCMWLKCVSSSRFANYSVVMCVCGGTGERKKQGFTARRRSSGT